MQNKTIFFLLGIVLLLTAPQPARSDLLTPHERQWLVDHPEIRVAFRPDYQPYTFTDSSGQFQGIVADYLTRLEQILSVKFSRVLPSMEQSANDVPAAKGADVVSIFAVTPNRQTYWQFVEPLVAYPLYLIVRDGAAAPKSLGDFKSGSVSVVENYAARKMLETVYPGLSLDLVPDTRTGLQHVSFGASQGFVSDLPVASWWLNTESLTNLRVAGETGLHYRMGMAVRKDWPELLSILSKGMNEISPAEKEAIYQKWVHTGPLDERSSAEVLRPLLVIAIPIAVAVLVLYLWNRTLRRKIEDHARHQQAAFERIRQHHDAILALASHPYICHGNLPLALRAITKSAAVSLAVERVSLWMFSDDQRALRCLSLYEAKQQKHSDGAVLLIDDYPRYFEALKTQRAIDAHDAIDDIRTSEFSEHYLKPLGIASMLDAPIRSGGRLIGVVCSEHIGSLRTWTADEQHFAASIADLTALALEVSQRMTAQEALAKLNNELEAKVEARTGELIEANARLRSEILERERIELSLRESELRLRLSTRAGNIGIWDWDLRDDSVTYSTVWKRQLGHAEHEIANHFSEFESRLHPDDKERVLAANRDYIAGQFDEYSAEFRLRHQDGSYRWILSRGEVIARDSEQAIRVAGCHVDITTLKQAEEKLRAFRWFADSAGQGMGMATWDGTVIYMNPFLAQTLGCPDWQDMPPRNFPDYYSESAQKKLHGEVFPALRSEGQWLGELEMLNRDGSAVPTLENYFVVKDDHSHPQYIAATISDISKQKSIERQLLHAREAAESADRIKSMFVASMSHELRTPLNSIIGFTDVVLQGMSGELNDRQKDQLGRAYRSAKHLLALITDVIDLSKVEAGYLDTYVETFAVRDVIEEVLQSVHYLANQKTLELRVSDPENLRITSDRKRFFQCVLNLVSNAVKYSERGWVRISVAQQQNEAQISVQDTGIGMDATSLTRIFAPFERIESRLKINTPGTGLGLYLTRKIARELLHGDISVVSEPEQGSTFTLQIPLILELPAKREQD